MILNLRDPLESLRDMILEGIHTLTLRLLSLNLDLLLAIFYSQIMRMMAIYPLTLDMQLAMIICMTMVCLLGAPHHLLLENLNITRNGVRLGRRGTIVIGRRSNVIVTNMGHQMMEGDQAVPLPLLPHPLPQVLIWRNLNPVYLDLLLLSLGLVLVLTLDHLEVADTMVMMVVVVVMVVTLLLLSLVVRAVMMMDLQILSLVLTIATLSIWIWSETATSI
jgi:hypothetical protein